MCPVCNGTGRMKVFGKKCDASILGGQYRCYNGYFSSNEPVYQVYSDIVTDIHYYISDEKESEDITYTLKKGIDNWTTMFDEEYLFATQEEAQTECNKRNEFNKGVESNNYDVT